MIFYFILNFVNTVLFLLIRSMLRHEELYPNPYTFDPERFLNKNEKEEEKEDGEENPDPRRYVFGFGRRFVFLPFPFFFLLSTKKKNRRCPGANLVESSLWLLIASMLACFDISKEVDENGKEIEVVPEFDNAIFR
jgi:cytochrome P450